MLERYCPRFYRFVCRNVFLVVPIGSFGWEGWGGIAKIGHRETFDDRWLAASLVHLATHISQMSKDETLPKVNEEKVLFELGFKED